MPLQIEDRLHGTTRDGAAVRLYELTNGRGTSLALTNFGAITLSLRVPDRDGKLEDVLLGYPSIDEYLEENRPYFGAVVGRCANRIRQGDLVIDGAPWPLACNDGANHLHGGRRGFDRVVWSGAPFRDQGRAGVILRYLSRDGEEGYPGDLAAEVTIALTEADELTLDYAATTSRATACNLTFHGYFNLAAGREDDVLGHLLTIDADRFTPVGPGLIPTGELRPVAGTPLDFRMPRSIGARIKSADEEIALAGGYDHNWVLNRKGPELTVAARLVAPATGRAMEVLTTEPGLQFYSGNFLDGTIVGKGAVAYRRNAGLCLETQHFPDAPHHPHFPSVVLRPGETYRSRTVYRFSTVR
jgi:aldose 1-epimerase